jgi:putative oxidoreductase
MAAIGGAKMKDWVLGLPRKVVALTKKLDWVALLVARMTVGILFVSTGWGKVHNIDQVTGLFTDLHIPAPGFNAVLASYTELIGGALLVIGLASRFVSIPLMVTMVVALVTAKADEIHGLPDLFGEVEWTYLALLFVITAFGPGALSLDALFANKSRSVARPAPAPAQASA